MLGVSGLVQAVCVPHYRLPPLLHREELWAHREELWAHIEELLSLQGGALGSQGVLGPQGGALGLQEELWSLEGSFRRGPKLTEALYKAKAQEA